MHFVTKLRPTFWNLHKITNFLYPQSHIMREKKFRILLSGFGQILFSHKNKSRAETTGTHIMKNAFSILVLDSQPESIFRWAICRFQNHSTLLYSTNAVIIRPSFDVLIRLFLCSWTVLWFFESYLFRFVPGIC